jgi:hypothetical protein
MSGRKARFQHIEIHRLLGYTSGFVIHSLRHTMLTRLWEAGVDAFSIMKIEGRNATAVSERYVHPPPESPERAFELLGSPKAYLSRQSDATFEAATISTAVGIFPTIVPTVGIS